MSPSYDTLSRLLDEPNSDGAELYDAACELRESFVRSEHMIGLLPGDAPDLLVAGLERAGAAGVVDAWLELGRLLAFGAAPWAPYPERDVDASIAAYRKADDAGSRDGALGWVRRAYFARSAEHADAAARRLGELLAAAPEDADLLVLTGYLVHQGYGHEADAELAARYHRKAADRGSADAAFELSVLYATGSGVPVDQDEADRWTVKAAELGSDRAMANLGGMYATGRGVPHDPATGLRWYARAADAGHANAAFTAGFMCLVGDGGLPVDRDAARDYFSRAEELGFDVDEVLADMGQERP